MKVTHNVLQVARYARNARKCFKANWTYDIRCGLSAYMGKFTGLNV